MRKFIHAVCALGMITFAGTSCSSDDPDVPEELPPAENAIHFEEPANTYIVSQAGRYSFDTRTVSGKDINNISSAGWIWATKQAETDTEQKLISDVKYHDGQIYFTASEEKGNAVIAAFDASGKSVWVWLIWFTDKPGDNECENGAVFMDRAMGATSAKQEDGDKTAGTIVYQWGRNVPFFGGYESEMDENGNSDVFKEANKWTIMNPDYGYQWKFANRQVTISESLAAPTTFYILLNTGTWQLKKDLTLWAETKTDYDPSPAGYQLPKATAWQSFIKGKTGGKDDSGMKYEYNGSTMYMPFGNCGRAFDNGEYVTGMQNETMYWNGSLNIDDWGPVTKEYPSRAMFYPGGVWPETSDAMANPSFAHAVRCIKSSSALD